MTFTDYINESKPTQEQFKKWVESTKFKNEQDGVFQLKVEELKEAGNSISLEVEVSKGTGSSPAYKGNLDWIDEFNFIEAVKKKFNLKFFSSDVNTVIKGKQSTNCMNLSGFRISIEKDSFK